MALQSCLHPQSRRICYRIRQKTTCHSVKNLRCLAWTKQVGRSVKWALESTTMNKASGSDGIPVELFQILKDDAVKVLHSICQKIWKTQQWPQDWKISVFISIPKKGNAKECSNYHTNALISHASKVILKNLQARLQQYMNHEFQMFKLDLENAEEPEIKLPASAGSWKKQENSRKTSTSALLTMPKHLTVWITITCGTFFKRWKYQITWPASWEICMQVRKQQLELGMEQQTGSKLGKEYVRLYIVNNPAYLTYRQSTSCEMLG